MPRDFRVRHEAGAFDLETRDSHCRTLPKLRQRRRLLADKLEFRFRPAANDAGDRLQCDAAQVMMVERAVHYDDRLFPVGSRRLG